MKKSTLLTTSLVGLTVCSGLVLSSTLTYADDSVTDTTSITVPVSCSMTGTVNTPHTATLNPGTWSGASGSEYQNGIGKTTLTTFCNDNNGFSVYAVGNTGDTLGQFGSIILEGNNTNSYITTKVYDPTDSFSSWSMKVTKVTDATQTFNPNNMTITNSFDSWHTIPSDYSKVAEYKATTGSSTTDTDLGAKLETTYAAYISQTQPADTYTGKVKYVMVHPYDHAAPIIPISIADAETMQEVNTCPDSLTVEEIYSIQDIRDHQYYKVAKLRDGKCWMVENLNLAGGTLMTSNNTDFPSTYSLPTNNGWQSDGRLPESSTSGFDMVNYAYVYNTGNKTNYCSNPGCYSYYSWDAATVGSGRSITTWDTNAPYSICPKGWKLPSAFTISKTDWQTTSDYYVLAHQYGLESTVSVSGDGAFNTQAGPGTVPNFLKGGFYASDSLYWSGTNGYYWSSTSLDIDNARDFRFDSSSVNASGYEERGFGYSVRCYFAGQ